MATADAAAPATRSSDGRFAVVITEVSANYKVATRAEGRAEDVFYVRKTTMRKRDEWTQLRVGDRVELNFRFASGRAIVSDAVPLPPSPPPSPSGSSATVTVEPRDATPRPSVHKIDAHLHIWSNGSAPFEWASEPPAALHSVATAEKMRDAGERAGVGGALIVQPANHKFDHSYVAAALQKHPDYFRGMMLVDGSLPPLEAVASLESLWRQGFVAARFNPSLFPAGLDGPTGKALFKRCGELSMPVGIMTFTGLMPHLQAIRALAALTPTDLIIDHMGFFRQPATGGLVGEAAANDEAAWEALLSLADLPNVHVKLSAFFRLSAALPPHRDLEARVAALVAAFGARRLLWGSDFPFVIIGGNTPTDAGCSYAQASAQLGSWSVPGLDDDAYRAIMGGNAQRLFGFWETP